MSAPVHPQAAPVRGVTATRVAKGVLAVKLMELPPPERGAIRAISTNSVLKKEPRRVMPPRLLLFPLTSCVVSCYA
jgi:hypothetical protein